MLNLRTERCRQSGAYGSGWRTFSSSMLIEDLVELPGNSQVSGVCNF